MLVTMSSDGNLRLWDVATQKLIGAPIPASTGDGTAEFFPDGTHVFGDFGSTGVVWNVDPVAWETQACRIAHRNLTHEEWNGFLGQRTYRPVCAAAQLDQPDRMLHVRGSRARSQARKPRNRRYSHAPEI